MLFVSGLFCSLSVGSQTAGWVKTADGQVNCKKINVQGEALKVVLENGEKQTMPVSSVVSYFNRSFKKLYGVSPKEYAGKER